MQGTRLTRFDLITVEESINIVHSIRKKIISFGLSGKLEEEHVMCFPSVGEIKVRSLMVKRRSILYHLSDLVPVRSVLQSQDGTWFLFVEAYMTPRVQHNLDIQLCSKKSKTSDEAKPPQDEYSVPPDETKIDKPCEMFKSPYISNEAKVDVHVCFLWQMGFQFACRAVYTAVWVAAVSLFMELLGFSTQKWITAGSFGTVLLTRAGREIFMNFLSSVMIHATRPFVVNEWIQKKIDGYEVSGSAENIVADMRKVLSKNPQVEQQRLHRRIFRDNVDPENQALMYTKLVSEEMSEIPIIDVLSSLHGPVVRKKKNLCTLEATSVVNYFHLLPYSNILSDWISRERQFDGSLPTPDGLAKLNLIPTTGSIETYDTSCSTGQPKNSPDKDFSTAENKIFEKQDGNCFLHGHLDGADDISLDSHGEPSPNKNATNHIQNMMPDQHLKEMKMSAILDQSSIAQNGVQIEEDMVSLAKKPSTASKQATKNSNGGIGFTVEGTSTVDSSLNCAQLAAQQLDEIQGIGTSKRTALVPVVNLVNNPSSHAIKNGKHVSGNNNDDDRCAIQDGRLAGDLSLVSADFSCQQLHKLEASAKGDASLQITLIALQKKRYELELDEICYENNWILPRYNVLPSVANGKTNSRFGQSWYLHGL
ncbi:hypothetical protein QJS10_CPA05g02031 [Acorus calamus]|uniref:Uncharacterized protein n=1 Tax=Acorus calamus TaxID=4465 RepID=A0AAV9EYY4_ACOCL|nr:hypothetical protein QJS10_CPA05g02031 [Acorus calamus]